jgi:hypothetical protein
LPGRPATIVNSLDADPDDPLDQADDRLGHPLQKAPRRGQAGFTAEDTVHTERNPENR